MRLDELEALRRKYLGMAIAASRERAARGMGKVKV